MRRFANRQPVRMHDGTPENMAQNTTPMSTQDAGAFAAMGGPQGVALAAPPQFGPGRVDDTQNAARTARMAMYGRASDNANAITAMSNPTAPAADPDRRERIERKLAAGQRTQTFMPTMGNIQTEAFDPHIRQLVLRDGGTVPGKGTGDKIPALYEPGEFVVSNDMLDAKPGLREQLHDLRGNVLAAKGKSVEQADAEAVSGGTLRAQSGMAPLLGLDPAVANRAAESARQAAFEADTLAKAKLRAETMTQQARSMPPNSGPPNAPPGYRAGQKFTNGLKFASKVAPAVGAAIEAGDVYDVAKDPNTTKIDVGTQAAEGVSKLAGATAGGLAGAAVGGPFAPLTGLVGGIAGYYAPELVTKGLRWATGHDTASPIDRVRAQESAKAATPAAVPVTTPAAVPVTTPAAVPVAAPTPAAQTLRGADGRQYLPEAVTDADRLRSDTLVNKAFGRDTKSGGKFSMDAGINTLRGDPNAMKQANEAWAMRGAGIQASRDAKGGLVLSNSTGPEKMQYVGRNGTPTARYEDTAQYDNGQTQLAAARATLRNPDGSTWSARDNAVMAANLRDGVDPYRGTSRQKNDEHAQMQALASSPVGTIGRRGAMRRMAQIEQNQTTLRGQDLDMQRAHAQTSATLRKNEFDMNRDIRKDAREQETHAQAVGDKAREGFAKEFGAFNPDGTPNQGLTAAKISAMQRLFPGIDMTSPEGRSKYLPDAQSTAKIYERIASNPQMGMDKLITAKGPGYDAMPDWKGATLKQQGYVGGKLTPGSEPNGWYITHNRVDTPLGADLSQRELEIIRHATKTGSWRGAPKNTQ